MKRQIFNLDMNTEDGVVVLEQMRLDNNNDILVHSVRLGVDQIEVLRDWLAAARLQQEAEKRDE